MDFDRFLGREYDSKTSTCFDLVADFYAHNLNIDLRKELPVFTAADKTGADRTKFRRIALPTNLCLCVYKPYNVKIEPAHVGIYWRRSIFHIDEGGVRFSDLELLRLSFASVRYYEHVRTDTRKHI